jgi:diaminohydroxyphosphoribosylaminopyrimidine deaminase/5-amino-6-(5-phosphoribosylamino)uracil reductase
MLERLRRAYPAATSAESVGAVMIEGGGKVAASFFEAGLVDALEWFRAPMVLGDEGRPGDRRLRAEDAGAAPRWRRTRCGK